MKYILIAFLIIVLFIISVLKKKEVLTKNKAFVLKSAIIIFILECSIFNIHSYVMDFSKAQKQEYSDDKLENCINVLDDGTQFFLVDNLDSKVDTIYLEVEGLEENNLVDYDIGYSDDTTEGRTLARKTYCDDVQKTKYTTVHLIGNAKKIELKVYNSDVKISKVILNDRIPFEFNFIRDIILFLIVLFIYSLKTNAFWKEKYSVKNLKQNLAFMLIIDFSLLIIYFFNTYCGQSIEPIEDLYNTKLISALSKGQVYLEDKPNEKFADVKNPYDTVERNQKLERDTEYIWDAALYNGHYYVYFGIVPALILFLPYYLITGKFMQTATGVLIFSLLAMLVILLLVKEIFKRYFKDVPFKFMVFSAMIMAFGTLLIWINATPRFYELVTVAGLFFAVLGLLLFLTADKKSEDEKNISFSKVLLGSLSLAIAVGCRPTQLFTSILIIPIIWELFKIIKSNKKNIVKLILCICIPYVIVGILLMWYNYIRFGSIFEFGSNYQLTINDMKSLGFRINTILPGVLCDLFNLPIFKSVFPFVSANANLIETFSYYYIEDIPAGIFFLAPITFLCFRIIKFYKTTNKKEIKILVTTLILVGLILCVFVSMQAGSTGRYFLDFAWMFVLAGIMIFMSFYENYKSNESKQVLTKIFTIIMIFTVIINILFGFSQIGSNGMMYSSPEMYFNVDYSISIWK